MNSVFVILIGAINGGGIVVGMTVVDPSPEEMVIELKVGLGDRLDAARLEAKNAAFDVGAIVFEAKVDWVDTVFIVLDEYTAVLEENVA